MKELGKKIEREWEHGEDSKNRIALRLFLNDKFRIYLKNKQKQGAFNRERHSLAQSHDFETPVGKSGKERKHEYHFALFR